MSVPGGARWSPAAMPLRQAPGQAAPGDRAAGTGDGRPGPAGQPAPPGRPGQPGAGRPGRPRLTGRGAIIVMLAIFLAGNLIAGLAHVPWLGGLGYAAGCVLASTYARRGALLVVVTTPPLIFLGSLLGTEMLTAGGGTLLATAEGTMLTLAAVAPWLFAWTAGCLVIALVRGLPQCVRDLRADLNGQPATAGRPGASGPVRQL